MVFFLKDYLMRSEYQEISHGWIQIPAKLKNKILIIKKNPRLIKFIVAKCFLYVLTIRLTSGTKEIVA